MKNRASWMALLLLIMALLMVGPVGAEEASIHYNLVDGVLTISGTGAMENYDNGPAPWFDRREEIQQLVIQPGVTKIGQFAFAECSSLTSVSMPTSVTSIGSVAFAACSSLTNITIHSSTTSIGEGAFDCCEKLADIYYTGNASQWAAISIENGNDVLSAATIHYNAAVADNFTYALENGALTICGTGPMANYTSGGAPWYSHHEEIQQVVIQPGITSVGEWAFYNCINLTNVVLPSSVTYIGESASYGCSRLTDIYYTGSIAQSADIYIGDNNVTLSSADIYYNCVVIGNLIYSLRYGELTIAGTGPMEDYDNTAPWYSQREEIQQLVIQPGVTSIGELAFAGCSSLISVSMPSSVTSIGRFAFAACSSLTNISIPSSVDSIGLRAFIFCSSLASVSIPSSVTSIGEEAFDCCENLTDICYTGSASQWAAISIENGNDVLSAATIHYNAAVADNFTYALENGTLTICGTGPMANYTSGGAPWYSHREEIQQVIIHPGITYIGEWAFCNCSMTSVLLPSSVTYIGDYATYGCSSLTDIYFACSSAQSKDVYIDDSNVSLASANRYYNCVVTGNLIYSLEDGVLIITGKGPMHNYTSDDAPWYRQSNEIQQVIIQPGVTTIGERAFYSCTNLISVSIPDSIVSIGSSAFCLGSATFYASIGSDAAKELSKELFFFQDPNCSGYSLQYVFDHDSVDGDAVTGLLLAGVPEGIVDCVIPRGVTIIESFTFDDCSSLTTVTIPDSVTRISDHAFDNCTSLTSADIPDSVTCIGEYAFAYCTSLTSINIPDGVTSICNYAFQDCTSLISINIPDSVISIEDSAFFGCSATLYASIGSDAAKELSKAFYSFQDPNCSGYSLRYGFDGYTVTDDLFLTGVPEGIVDCVVIPDGVTIVTGDAFYNWAGISGITSVTIPDSVTCIGEYAFENFTNLTSVNIPDSVTCIGYQAFYNCTNLTGLSIPDSVTSIDARAFYNCTSLTGLSIPNSVTSIGERAFYNCTSLTSIAIPGNITIIGDYTFYKCTNLTSVTILDGVPSIGDKAFADCDGLTNMVIPSSVTSIGESALFDCDKLTDVYYTGNRSQWDAITIGSRNDILSAATIHYNAMQPDLILPSSITHIEAEAFAGIPTGIVVQVPAKVAFIAADAFPAGTALLLDVGSPWINWAAENGYIPIIR